MNEDDEEYSRQQADYDRQYTAYCDAMQSLAYELHLLQTCAPYKWMGADV